jgi:hypothetical protein
VADPEALELSLTQRDVDLLRVQADVTRKAIRSLRDLEGVTLGILRDIDPSEPMRRGDRFNRVTRVGTLLKAEARRTYRGIARRFVRTQAELLQDESFNVVRQAQRAGLPLSRTISQQKAASIVDGLLVDGATSSQHWNRQQRGLQDSITAALRRVVVADGTLTDMTRAIRGERALNYANGVYRAYERFARVTVSTGLSAASNSARYETYVANSDVVTMVQAINPLDSRTSDICRARAGRTWALRSGASIGHGNESFPGPPPWHLGCRTTLVPLGREDNPIRGQTFGGLLDSMSERQQKDMLGPGKFELWRKGDIAMGDLIDQSGRPLTLAQLRERST